MSAGAISMGSSSRAESPAVTREPGFSGAARTGAIAPDCQGILARIDHVVSVIAGLPAQNGQSQIVSISANLVDNQPVSGT
jgi:hypothetical protein